MLKVVVKLKKKLFLLPFLAISINFYESKNFAYKTDSAKSKVYGKWSKTKKLR